MLRLLRKVVNFVRSRLAPAPFAVPVPPPARIVYPRVMQAVPPPPPRTVVLNFRAEANHIVVHSAFEYALWCGQHNMNPQIKTPGDGTIQIVFADDQEEIMFRLAWNDDIMKRSSTRY